MTSHDSNQNCMTFQAWKTSFKVIPMSFQVFHDPYEPCEMILSKNTQGDAIKLTIPEHTA